MLMKAGKNGLEGPENGCGVHRRTVQEVGISRVPMFTLLRACWPMGTSSSIRLQKPGWAGFPWQLATNNSSLKDYFYTSERLRQPLEVQDVTVVSPSAAGGVKLGGGNKVVMVLDPQTVNQGMKRMEAIFTKVKDIAAALAGTGTEVVLLVQNRATQIMQAQGGTWLRHACAWHPGVGGRQEGPAIGGDNAGIGTSHLGPSQSDDEESG